MNKVLLSLVLVGLVYACTVSAASLLSTETQNNQPPVFNTTGTLGQSDGGKNLNNPPVSNSNSTLHSTTKTIAPIDNDNEKNSNTTTTTTATTTTNTTTTTPTPTPTKPTSPTPPTTHITTSTINPTTGTTPITTTVQPVPSTTSKPDSGGGFNIVSFLGGFILGLGLLAIAYVVYKFYKNRGDLSYRTL